MKQSVFEAIESFYEDDVTVDDVDIGYVGKSNSKRLIKKVNTLTTLSWADSVTNITSWSSILKAKCLRRIDPVARGSPCVFSFCWNDLLSASDKLPSWLSVGIDGVGCDHKAWRQMLCNLSESSMRSAAPVQWHLFKMKHCIACIVASLPDLCPQYSWNAPRSSITPILSTIITHFLQILLLTSPTQNCWSESTSGIRRLTTRGFMVVGSMYCVRRVLVIVAVASYSPGNDCFKDLQLTILQNHLCQHQRSLLHPLFSKELS